MWVLYLIFINVNINSKECICFQNFYSNYVYKKKKPKKKLQNNFKNL